MIVRYPSLAKKFREARKSQSQPKTQEKPKEQEIQKSIRIGDWHIVEHEGNLVALEKNGNITILVFGGK